MNEVGTHVYPLGDEVKHEMSPDCWCHPKPDHAAPNLYIHNSFDGREMWEVKEVSEVEQ